MQSCEVDCPWVPKPTGNWGGAGWTGEGTSPCPCCWPSWICFNNVINDAATCGWLWSAESTVNNTCIICWFWVEFVNSCSTVWTIDAFIWELCCDCCCWRGSAEAVAICGAANPKPVLSPDPWKAPGLCPNMATIPPFICDGVFNCGDVE